MATRTGVKPVMFIAFAGAFAAEDLEFWVSALHKTLDRSIITSQGSPFDRVRFLFCMVCQQFIGIAEQTKASIHRLDDANALYKAARWRGAMYMAGYAVECLIKSKLMQMYHCRHLRELEREGKWLLIVSRKKSAKS